MLTPAHVERYWRIRNNPYKRHGMKFEDAIVFCDGVERDMEKLTDREQTIVQYVAAGYRQDETAKACGMSLRSVARGLHNLRLRPDVMIPIARPR